MGKNIMVLDEDVEWETRFTGDKLAKEIERFLEEMYMGEFIRGEEGIMCQFFNGKKFLIAVKEIV